MANEPFKQFILLDRGKAQYFPAYLKMIQEAWRLGIAKARKRFGTEFGGLDPQGDQFGVTTIRPEFLGVTGGEWKHTRTTGTGWQDLMNKSVKEDIIIVIVGFAWSNPDIQISQLKVTAAGKTLPILDVEEVKALDSPMVLLPQPLVVGDKQELIFRSYNIVNTGNEYLIPIGYAFCTKDNLYNETIA